MSQGFQSKFGMDTANPTTKGYEFTSESLVNEQQIVDASGLRGTASMRSERTRLGNQAIGGTVNFEPSPEDLGGTTGLLAWIFSGTPTGSGPITYPLADTVATRFVQIDKIGKVFLYTGVAVSRATFSGTEGSVMSISLELLALSETIANAGSFPSVTYNNTPPFMFTDCILTILTTARSVKNWSLTVDNMLVPLYYNSVTPTQIKRQGRRVTFSCQTPFTSAEVDLYNQALLGGAATLDLPFANYELVFNFATLQFPRHTPAVPGRSEIPLMLNGEARMVSTTESLITTLDSTP